MGAAVVGAVKVACDIHAAGAVQHGESRGWIDRRTA